MLYVVGRVNTSSEFGYHMEAACQPRFTCDRWVFVLAHALPIEAVVSRWAFVAASSAVARIRPRVDACAVAVNQFPGTPYGSTSSVVTDLSPFACETTFTAVRGI